MALREVNFDGLVGNTHNHAGLAPGNLASERSRGSVANPRAAALEGLEKMWLVASLGVPQAVLPPHERPHLPTLRRLGFSGSNADVLAEAAAHPQLLTMCSSAAAMWTANAATVVPACDSGDGRTHLVPANLRAHFHRALEVEQTARVLRTVFADPDRFVVHDALPAAAVLSDEGAANHLRFCRAWDEPGVHLFVYGRAWDDPEAPLPRRYVPRQSFDAAAAVARLTGVHPGTLVFAQQSPDAIDAGVFHADVAAMGHQHVFVVHERAFTDTWAVIGELERRLDDCFHPIVIHDDDLTLEDAVETYLFNSQIVSLPNGRMAMLAPSSCAANDRAAAVLEALSHDRACPIDRIELVDLPQSLRNGGGPACLRLRVLLSDEDIDAIGSRCLLTQSRYRALRALIERRYRDRLAPGDLADPTLLVETHTILDEVSSIFGLGSIYGFQRAGA
jgi:succinylarginine dihydrolase